MRTKATTLAAMLTLIAGFSGRWAAQSALAQSDQVCDEGPLTDYRQTISRLVDGDELRLTVSSRFGGAVESVTWRGKEFINIWDHGRQISYAWGMDGYGECLNPTEPGSASDYQNLSSTSELLSVCRSGNNRLTTTTRPAYWLRPGESGFCNGVTSAVNDAIVTDQVLEKTIEIGHGGIDNVIAFTATITLPEDYDSNQLEIPTGYLTYEFNDYWLFNPQTGELTEPESQELHAPWSFEHVTNLPPILATPDGAYAMGAYSTEPISYYSILFYDVPNSADRTNKWNIVIREEPAPAGAYTYQSFAIVGTLNEVQRAMTELYAMHPADFSPPEGYVDAANCTEIAGWAWDPKTPDKPIEVAIFDVNEDGGETHLGQVTANLPRPDLPPVLGDNGRHGYRLETGDIIQDGERHTIRAYGVNSDSTLPDRALIPAESSIECPELAQAPPTEPPTLESPSGESDANATETPNAGGRRVPCAFGMLPMAAGLITFAQRKKRS